MGASSGESTRAAVLAALLLAGCGEQAGLVEVAHSSGIEFTHDEGFRDTYYFPETLGSGVALVDLEADGDLDLYALQAGIVPGTVESTLEPSRPTNRLWRGDGAGSFEDVTAESGAAAHDGYATGVCAGDVNGDGLLDLFLTNFGPDALLVNRGELRFEDTARETPLADGRWTTASGFADLDRDGHLDLVVCGFVAWTPETREHCGTHKGPDYCEVAIFDGIGDRVYRGDGRGGFEDRTQAWGLVGQPGRGLGLALVDLDGDGDVDLYVANDSVENHVWLNDGTGRFENATYTSGGAYNVDGMAEAGMGVGVTDTNGDALPDILVTNFAGESNTLYEGTGGGRFRDASRRSGLTALSRSPLGFGAAFADLDRDGVEDLLVTNGHVLRHVHDSRAEWTFAQADQVFRGLRGGQFVEWDVGDAFARPTVGRGLAVGDFDGDGAVDVVRNGAGERLELFRNRLALDGSGWLVARLKAKGSNTAAIGARVQLLTDDGRVQTRWVRSGTSFESQDDLRPHFGLPAGVRAVELRVRWPDGTQGAYPLAGEQRVVAVEQAP